MATSTNLHGELRKHRCQMSTGEIRTIESSIHFLDWRAELRHSVHAIERLAEKNISEAALVDSLTRGEVIEAKRTPAGELRFVLRFDEVAVVVAMGFRKRIVTAWRNSVLDNHATLNLKLYTWKARFGK